MPLGPGAALTPVLALVVLVALAFYHCGDAGAAAPTQIAIVCAGLVSVLVGRLRGYSLEALREAAVKSVSYRIAATFILFAVGSLIVTWVMSGMLGIGLVRIAQQMDLSPAVTAGAVVSSAYFGGESSPPSDSVNLDAAATGANPYDHIRETLWTSIPTLALTLFAMLGAPGDFDATGGIDAIARSYTITPLLSLPLALVFVLAIPKWRPFTTIFLGALTRGFVAVLLAPERVTALAADSSLPAPLAL